MQGRNVDADASSDVARPQALKALLDDDPAGSQRNGHTPVVAGFAFAAGWIGSHEQGLPDGVGRVLANFITSINHLIDRISLAQDAGARV
jgi:hypothetical protein